MGEPLTIIVRGVGGAHAELHLRSNSTFLDLLTEVDKRLRLKLGVDAVGERLRILTGFPPRPLTLAGSDAIGGHIMHKESLKIEVKPDRSAELSPLPNTASSSEGRKRKVKVTTAQTKKKAAEKRQKPSPGSSNIHTLGGGIRQINKTRRPRNVLGGSQEEIASTLVSAQAGADSPTKGKTAMFWRRVMSSAVANQYEQTKAVDRVAAARAGSYLIEEDIANGGRRISDGTAGALLVRFPKAGQLKRFMAHLKQHQENPQSNSSSTSPSALESSKSYHVDSGLTDMKFEELQNVLREIISGDESDREMVKPDNMALCSPRVFWAVIKHSRRYLAESSVTTSTFDFGACLRAVVPNGDWSFLYTRVRKRSEKALANLAQERVDSMAERDNEGEYGEKDLLPMNWTISTDRCDVKAAANTVRGQYSISSSSLASSSLTISPTATTSNNNSFMSARDRAAAAAEARFKGTGSTSKVGEAIAPTSSSTSPQASSSSLATTDVAHSYDNHHDELDSLKAIVEDSDKWWLDALDEGAGIKSIVALADVNDPAAVAKAIEISKPSGTLSGPSAGLVAQWVTAARNQRSGAELRTIVGGESTTIDNLALVKVTTVRDLILWSKRPKILRAMLTRALKGYNSAESASTLAADVALRFSDERQAAWLADAVSAVARRPWLDDWLTSV